MAVLDSLKAFRTIHSPLIAINLPVKYGNLLLISILFGCWQCCVLFVCKYWQMRDGKEKGRGILSEVA